MTATPIDPFDLLDPACSPGTVERAGRRSPASLAPGTGELLRFGWASGVLEAHPELHEAWAIGEDRAIRRALMRSPALPAHVAEEIVEVRRSGMHTLGSNPAAPLELLADNPGARRRRAAVDRAAPTGIEGARAEPNRVELVELGSPTLDLVLARADGTTLDTARALAGRARPALDPWSAAVLIDRFGDEVVRTHEQVAAANRVRVVHTLLEALGRTGGG